MEIRNIAIIAHVDHGKTTLIDAMLKQTHTFRTNEKEMGETLIMDSNTLERERGITILAKNTAVFYQDYKINIIDTPGHADFAGEVERIINMASGAILLVDAAEGVLPQTKFVLKKALEEKLKIIVLINKIDKKDARPLIVLREVEELFLDLVEDAKSLHFKTLFTVGRDGKAFSELPSNYTSKCSGDLKPLFDLIINETPNTVINTDLPFQMLISTLDYDNYIGKICIGKIKQGKLEKGQMISLIDENKILGTYKVQKLFVNEGLKRTEVDLVSAGDIVSIAGIPEMNIGQTVTDPLHPISLPKISIEEPTIKITLGPNTSPLSGKEGKRGTSRQIRERLLKEKETNLGLKIEEGNNGSNFTVSGRGELHLAILIETMRREGFEMEISKPKVIYKIINGIEQEPYEEVTIDIDKDYLGLITEEMGKRKGQLLDLITNNNSTKLKYKISDNNLLGIRSNLLTQTKGTIIFNEYFLGYYPKGEKMESIRNGALIAVKPGEAVTYGLVNAQNRGALFVGPGSQIYEGLVVGVANRNLDIGVNVCKEKKLTNNRSAGEGVSEPLEPPTVLSLEQALDFINEDEILEVTPKNIRIRKILLSEAQRRVAKRG